MRTTPSRPHAIHLQGNKTTRSCRCRSSFVHTTLRDVLSWQLSYSIAEGRFSNNLCGGCITTHSDCTRSRPLSRLYRSVPGAIASRPPSSHPPGLSSFRPPSSLRVYSSLAQNMVITEVEFTSQQSAKDNHSEKLQLPGMDALLRRGNTLVLRIKLSAEISCPYCVSLTFVPVFRPRDRFGQFQAKGAAKGSSDLWLSITIPANFPIGKYHAHIAVALKGGLQVITYFHHKPIVILFNPWNPGHHGILYFVTLLRCLNTTNCIPQSA